MTHIWSLVEDEGIVSRRVWVLFASFLPRTLMAQSLILPTLKSILGQWRVELGPNRRYPKSESSTRLISSANEGGGRQNFSEVFFRLGPRARPKFVPTPGLECLAVGRSVGRPASCLWPIGCGARAASCHPLISQRGVTTCKVDINLKKTILPKSPIN